MANIIILVFILWLLFAYPQMLFGAVITIGVLCYSDKIAKYFRNLTNEVEEEEESEVKQSKVDPRLKAIYGDFVDDDGIIDWDGYNQAKVDAMMKADFEKDPEYQEKFEKVRKHMEENRIKARVEEVEDKNREIRDKEQEFWAKRR